MAVTLSSSKDEGLGSNGDCPVQLDLETAVIETCRPPSRACALTGELVLQAGVDYSHSIVEGGFEVMSRTTRFTPGISFTIRLEIVSSRS